MGQCKGITKEGNRCKNKALEGSKYCRIHSKKSKKTGTSKVTKKTKAVTKKVTKERSPVKRSSEMCEELYKIYGKKEAERILEMNIEMGKMMKGNVVISPIGGKKGKAKSAPVKDELLGEFDESGIFIPYQNFEKF